MSQKLVDKLAPGGANFYTARSDEKWRHIHDVCTSLCDTSTTSARHAYEMKTRTRILNRLKFSPLLAEYLRHPETSLRHVKTFVRVPHDTWRVIASYNSQQLVAQTRDSVTGALVDCFFGIEKYRTTRTASNQSSFPMKKGTHSSSHWSQLISLTCIYIQTTFNDKQAVWVAKISRW